VLVRGQHTLHGGLGCKGIWGPPPAPTFHNGGVPDFRLRPMSYIHAYNRDDLTRSQAIDGMYLSFFFVLSYSHEAYLDYGGVHF